MKAIMLILTSITAITISLAGVKEDVTAAAKSSLSGPLIKEVTVKGSTATITYKSIGANDWNGTSRQRAAARCIPKVMQKAPTIMTVIIVIESHFKASMTRQQAVKFYGTFTSDEDFKSHVTDAVVYDKARLAVWEQKFVTLKK